MKSDRYLRDILPQAQNYGWVVAYGEYVAMSNPANQGSNWDWNKFEDWVVRRATTSVWSNFSEEDWKEFKDEILEAVEDSARLAARDVLRISDIQKWQPSPIPYVSDV